MAYVVLLIRITHKNERRPNKIPNVPQIQNNMQKTYGKNIISKRLKWQPLMCMLIKIVDLLTI